MLAYPELASEKWPLLLQSQPWGGGKRSCGGSHSSLLTLDWLSHTLGQDFRSLSEHESITLLAVLISLILLFVFPFRWSLLFSLWWRSDGVRSAGGSGYMGLAKAEALRWLPALWGTLLTGIDKGTLCKIWRAELSLLGQYSACS